jgi:acylphosphatase
MRRQVLFSGNVQGVGFRAAARDAATAFAVTGWVRNDPARTVTLEAQGDSGEIDAFIAEISRRMGRNIHSVQVVDIPPVENEHAFRIDY